MSVLASLNILVGMDIRDVQAGAKQGASNLKELERAAKSIWEGTREPMERYEQQLQRLAQLARAGRIDQETFRRGVRGAGVNLDTHEPTKALAEYRDKLESLSAQLQSGAIGQQYFASAASEARQEVEKSAAAAEKGESAKLHYEHQVKKLDAALHQGKITFAEYTEKVDHAKEAMERAERSASRLERGVDILKDGLATVGVVVGVERTFEFSQTSVELADEAKQSYGRLEGVLRATGESTGFTARQLHEMAKAEQDATNFDDIMVEHAEAVLAMHKNISGINFRRAIGGASDIAAVMGTDASSAAVALGKALADPVNGLTGLTRAGITFEQAERHQIATMMEAGRVAEAQSLVLDKLEQSIGGTAKAMRSDLVGLSHDWEDVKKSIGLLAQTSFAHESFSGYSEIFKDLADAIEGVSKAEDGAGNKAKAWLDVLNVGLGSVLPIFPYFFSDRGRIPVKRTDEDRNKAARRPPVLDDAANPDALASRDKLLSSLREEFNLWGEVGEARELARLTAAGLTEEELAETSLALKRVQALRAEAAAQAEQREHAKQLAADIDELTASLAEQVATLGMSAEEARIWKLAQQGAGQATLWQAKQLAKQLAGLREYREELEKTKRASQEAQDEADRIKEETRTPAEKLAAELDRLKKLRDANYLDDKTYARAQAKARKDFSSGAGQKEHGELPAMLKGSAEAFHAVARFQTGAGQSVQKKSLDELRKIRAALAGQAKEARKAAANKAAAQSPQQTRRQAQLAARARRAVLRRGNRPVDPDTLQPLAPQVKRKSKGTQNRQIAIAAGQADLGRQRRAAETRKQIEHLKVLEEIRRELQAQHRTQKNKQEPAVIRNF